MDTDALATSLAELRAEHGRKIGETFSLQDLRDELMQRLPRRYVPSVTKLHAMEKGTSSKADAILVCAIADTYGVSVRRLSPEVADELDMVADLLEHRRPCITARPGQLELAIA